MSASGLNFKIFMALCKLLGQSIHSKSYDNSLDFLCALILLWPGIWAAAICTSFFLYPFPYRLCNMMAQFWVGSAQFIDACYGSSTIWKKPLHESHDPWQLTWDLKKCILIQEYLYANYFLCQSMTLLLTFLQSMHPPMRQCISVINLCNIWVL